MLGHGTIQNALRSVPDVEQASHFTHNLCTHIIELISMPVKGSPTDMQMTRPGNFG